MTAPVHQGIRTVGVDVLAVMAQSRKAIQIAQGIASRKVLTDHDEARAAVAELIAAVNEYFPLASSFDTTDEQMDAALARVYEALARVTP